jgi:hypothetical protein
MGYSNQRSGFFVYGCCCRFGDTNDTVPRFDGQDCRRIEQLSQAGAKQSGRWPLNLTAAIVRVLVSKEN